MSVNNYSICVVRDPRAVEAAAVLCNEAFQSLSSSLEYQLPLDDAINRFRVETISDADLISLVLSTYQFLHNDPSGRQCAAVLKDHLKNYYQEQGDKCLGIERVVELSVGFLKIIDAIMQESGLIDDGEHIDIELTNYKTKFTPVIMFGYCKYS